MNFLLSPAGVRPRMSSVLGEMVANTLGRPHAPKRCKHAACDGGREGRCEEGDEGSA